MENSENDNIINSNEETKASHKESVVDSETMDEKLRQTNEPQQTNTEETTRQTENEITAEQADNEQSTGEETNISEEENQVTQADKNVDASVVGSDIQPEEKSFKEKKQKATKGWKFISLYVIVNISRFILAATLLFSAFVKANDPVGFSIKMTDYALAIGMTEVPEHLLVLATLIMVVIEAVIGIYLLVGVRRRRRIAALATIFMAVMTAITVWLVKDNPVTDCGCFGDAIILTNGQSLAKNIVLLAMALLITIKHKMMFRLIHKNWNWIITVPVVVALMLYTTYSKYMLPTVDFLPFAEGTDLRKTVAMGNGLDMTFKETIVYKRGNEILELSPEDDDPDSTWTYVETKSEMINDNMEAETQLFVTDNDGDDVTADMLEHDGYSFIITVPQLEKASDAIGVKFNDMYHYAQKNDYGFYFITGPADQQVKQRWIDNTETDFEFYESDDRILWQMVRSNPGIILLKDGVVIKKWSIYNIPYFDYNQPLEKADIQELLKIKRYNVQPRDFTKEKF